MQNSISGFGLKVNKVGTLDNDLKQDSRDSSPKMPKTPDVHVNMGITKSTFLKKIVIDWKKKIYALENDGTLEAIEKRNRTVSFVKSQQMYKKYVQTVPKEKRRPDMPKTPEPLDGTNPSEFHFKVQKWKDVLAKFENEMPKNAGVQELVSLTD